MDRQVLIRLLKISYFGIGLAGILFMILWIVGEPREMILLLASFSCLILSRLFYIIKNQLGEGD